MATRRSICLFGLSADPPTGHQGHVGIVQALQKLDEWDEIWVLPVYRHAFADKRQRVVSFQHRWNMCQAAFADLMSSPSSTKVVVSDAEFQTWKHAVKDISDEEEKAKVTVGTALLLDFLRATHATTDFTFCMGADAFLDLTAGKWKESARILEQLGSRRLVVLPRSTSSDATLADEGLLSRRLAETGARLMRIGHLGSISSSQVRECRNLEQLSTMVVPQVAEYMRANQLYQFAGPAPDDDDDDDDAQ